MKPRWGIRNPLLPRQRNSTRAWRPFYDSSSSSSSSFASLTLHSGGKSSGGKRSTAEILSMFNPPCCRNFLPFGGDCHLDIFLWLFGGHGKASHRPLVALMFSMYQSGRYPLEMRKSWLASRYTGVSALFVNTKMTLTHTSDTYKMIQWRHKQSGPVPILDIFYTVWKCVDEIYHSSNLSV